LTSAASTPPTPITSGWLAGKPTWSSPALPAIATITAPAAAARARASFSISVEQSGQSRPPQAKPSDRVITPAPRVAAQSMARATSEAAHSASSVQARIAISRAPCARPAAPTPLSVHCATMPAMKVPWPWTSAAAPSPSMSPTASYSAAKGAQARSSPPRETPLSITATTAPSPRAISQAASAWTAR